MNIRKWLLALTATVIMLLSATTLADGNPTYANVSGDLSIKYLNMLFGNVGGTLNQSFSGQTIGHMFYVFNQGILIACGVWVLIALASLICKLVDGDVQSVSKQGKTFLSICLGVILIVPSPVTGYSTVQNIIMKVVVQGTKLANGIWNYTVDQWSLSAPVFTPPQRINYYTNPETGFTNNRNDYLRVWDDLWNTGRGKAGILKDIVTAEVCYYDNLRAANTSTDGLFKNSINAEPLATIQNGASPKLVFGYGCGTIYFYDSSGNPSIKTKTPDSAAPNSIIHNSVTMQSATEENSSANMMASTLMTSVNQLAETSKGISCELASQIGKQSNLCQGFSSAYNKTNYDAFNNIAANNAITAISTLMSSLININYYIVIQEQNTKVMQHCRVNNVDLDTKDCIQKVIKPQLTGGGWINAGAFYWLISQGQSYEQNETEDMSTKISNSLNRIFIDKQVVASGIDPSKNKNLNSLLSSISNKMETTISNSSANSGASTEPVNTGDVVEQAKTMASQWKSLICGAPLMDTVCGNKSPSSITPPNENNTAAIKTDAFNATVNFLNASLTNMVALASNLTVQLNNANIDPQLILISSGFQMIATAAAQYQNYIILVLSVSTMLILLAVGSASGVCSFLCDAQAILISAFVKSVGGLFKKLALAMLGMGVMMAFYIPLYPWVVFTFAVIGWFIAVIQAMAAGPLICLGLTNPHGQDLSSSLRQSIMLLLSIFIRPALMIISLVMAMVLSRILFYFMLQGLAVIMNTLFVTHIEAIGYSITSDHNGHSSNTPLNQRDLWGSLTKMQGAAISNTQSVLKGSSMMTPQMLSANGVSGNLTSPYIKFAIQFVSIPTILALMSYMTYKIITHSYSLIFTVPTYVMKWIGGESAGESGALQQDANASKDAAQKGAKAGGSGLSQTTKARDSMHSAGVKATSTLASGLVGTVAGLFGGGSKGGDDDEEP